MHFLGLRALCTFKESNDTTAARVEWVTTAGHIETSNAVGLFHLDYMHVSDRVQGAASVVRGGFDLGDDWPIDPLLQLERKDLWGTISHVEFSQRGWAPGHEAAKRQGEARRKALTVEEFICTHAVRIDSDSAALRQWSELQNHSARLAELRSTLRQEAVREVRKRLAS